MGLVYTELTLRNAIDVGFAKLGNITEEEIRQTTVRALVDTGAGNLVINEAIREKLGLPFGGTSRGTLADGTKVGYQYVGPVEVIWKDRFYSGVVILLPDTDEVLLGAIPLQAMDLMVHPKSEELVGVHGDEVLQRL